MFSYYIHNPNNFTFEESEYTAIPFGHRCSSALACKYANIRKFSLVFDWCIPAFPKNIQKVLENDFIDFIPDVMNGEFVNKYNIRLAHFNNNKNMGIEEYKRRIERFKNCMNDSKIKKYFVYINEDYLYSKEYRCETFNKRVYTEMLELEKYLQNNYKFDYNILYFDFKEHDVPKGSKFVNIVLNSKQYYETANQYEQLRNFCGRILTTMFQTKLTLGYKTSVFIG